MDLLLNYIFAWAAVLIGVFLSMKYVIRKLSVIKGKHKKSFVKFNKTARKIHIPLGIAMIALGLIHGLFSGQNVLSMNFGTITLIIGVLLGVNYMARKMFKRGAWLSIHRLLTVAFLIFTVVHIVDAGGIKIFSAFDSYIKQEDATDAAGQESTADTTGQESTAVVIYETTSEESTTLEEYNENLFGVTLADGTYSAVARAFKIGLAVEVTVENNRVTEIIITDHNEVNERYYGKPMREIPAAIIEEQSLDIDVISGATYTSIGILNAVNKALQQAVISGELPRITRLP